MSKSSHNLLVTSRVTRRDSFTGNQGDLFQQLEQEPAPMLDLDIHFDLLAAITHAIRDARTRGMTRDRIVDRMNQLLPELHSKVTLRQLNAWTAPSQDYKEFPARFLPAFCAATECDLPLRVMSRPLGRDLIDARELVAKQLGEVRIRAAALKREERALTQQLQP